MTKDELLAVVRVDLDDTDDTLNLLEELRTSFVGREPTIHEMAAMGAYVRDAYTGMENILIRFAKFANVPVPDSAMNWHVVLFGMFCAPPTAGLPLLFPADVAARFQAYRGFRHVFHKRYAAHLDWPKLRPLVENASVTFGQFRATVR